MNNQHSEPAAGASCPLSHRIVRKTLFGIVKILLLSIAACLIYLVFTNH